MRWSWAGWGWGDGRTPSRDGYGLKVRCYVSGEMEKVTPGLLRSNVPLDPQQIAQLFVVLLNLFVARALEWRWW